MDKKRKFLLPLALQAADNGARSGRFTRDQPGESLWRTSSSVTADGSPGADPPGATAFEIQAFSGIQDLQQEAGKKRQDYAFWRQFNEKPSIIPGCPGTESR